MNPRVPRDPANDDSDDEHGKRDANSSTSAAVTVMKGINVYVTKKLQHIQDEINGIVASLGGEFSYAYDPAKVTHVIFQGKVRRKNDL